MRRQKSANLPTVNSQNQKKENHFKQNVQDQKNLDFITFRSRSQKQKPKPQFKNLKKPSESKINLRFEDSMANLKELDLGFSRKDLGKKNPKNKTRNSERFDEINFENKILSNHDEHEHDSNQCPVNCAQKIQNFRKFILKLNQGRRLSRKELLKIYDHVFSS